MGKANGRIWRAVTGLAAPLMSLFSVTLRRGERPERPRQEFTLSGAATFSQRRPAARNRFGRTRVPAGLGSQGGGPAI